LSTLTTVMRALADPTRRAILERLRERDLTAGAIADGFATSKPTISHHLALLREAGLVLAMRRGQHIVYSLNTTVLQEAMQWMMEFVEERRREAH